MHKKELTSTSKLLIGLLAAGDVLSLLFPTPREFRRRLYFGEWKNYNSLKSTLYSLHKRGLIKFIDKNNQRFIKLTGGGQIEVLLAKAFLPHSQEWDGKWRVLIFDIPEESREKRNLLRRLLKHNGFIKLQDSVFVNPYPLNREAITYLKESGLLDYIRIMKVEEMDNDDDLKKKFNLR